MSIGKWILLLILVFFPLGGIYFALLSFRAFIYKKFPSVRRRAHYKTIKGRLLAALIVGFSGAVVITLFMYFSGVPINFM